MISTGFPERSNTLSPSLYIYISTLSDEEGKKERRKEIGIEQFENARHDRGGVPMSRMESEDVCGEESPKPASFPLIQQ